MNNPPTKPPNMRLAALAFCCLLALAACGREAEEASEPAPVEVFGVPISDELPGLDASATGIAFWIHPNVAFNSLMIVAGNTGVVAYNVEDGVETARVPGVNAQGAAVSYLGFGRQARGLLTFFDREAAVFRIYEIDEVSRQFRALEGDVVVQGGVRGFCFGRGGGAEAPQLHVVQRANVTTYSLDIDNDAFAADPGVAMEAPEDVASCAVDPVDGALFIARESGVVHRIEGEPDFGRRFAAADVENAGELAALPAELEDGSVRVQIALLDRLTGLVHIFDRDDGTALGAIRAGAVDEMEAAGAATAMGATGANLGGLYRDGAIALGVGGDEPLIRLIPLNGVQNALSLPQSAAIDPRGEEAAGEEDDLLIIPTEPIRD